MSSPTTPDTELAARWLALLLGAVAAEVLARADAALYEAKAAGRDCALVAGATQPA
jgi:GGDEF domain-containing protein